MAAPASDGLWPGRVEVRVEVAPPSPFRLPRHGGLDGLTRARGGLVQRLIHVGGHPVWVRAAQPSPGRVVFGARAEERPEAEEGIVRMRRALGVDHDLRAFLERFRHDRLIGRSVRCEPGLRPLGRPDPFEALAWAVCEQLIEYQRAAAIQRRLIARLGARCAATGLRDAPTAECLAAQAPALLESLGLSGLRATALVRAAREVAVGRIELDPAAPEAGWRRLLRIRGIGRWTVQKLALEGQGRLDQVAAGDLAYIKLVGRLLSGHPWGRATESEVEEFFAAYHPWAGLAGAHALRGGAAWLRTAAAA